LAARLEENRAIRWRARAQDPNAGIAPCDTWRSEFEASGYTPLYFEDENGDYRAHDWARDHLSNHIGGTMAPSQDVPEFSPFYVEFAEEFGGYNFGGGNAQLDFKDMKFDWACG
jgi:hypothetical protein